MDGDVYPKYKYNKKKIIKLTFVIRNFHRALLSF